MAHRHAPGIAFVVAAVATFGTGAARAQPAVSTEPAVTGLLAPAPANGPRFGGALRARWVSVPGWFLGAFTSENVPLSAYAIGGEVFRRKGELDISLGLTYQRLGPKDGNWLGRGQDPAQETDFIQFRNFGFVGVDFSFIWRTKLSPYTAFHYGAGLGLAFMTGKMLRISAGTPGCKDTPGDEQACRPLPCPASGCTEDVLQKTEGLPDQGPTEPHRFTDSNIPGAIPILNLTLGFDFYIPDVPGLEIRLEGGFYDAFFLGLTTAYLF